jgi:hypothetical protein
VIGKSAGRGNRDLERLLRETRPEPDPGFVRNLVGRLDVVAPRRSRRLQLALVVVVAAFAIVLATEGGFAAANSAVHDVLSGVGVIGPKHNASPNAPGGQVSSHPTSAADQYCAGVAIHVRWHYSGGGSGSWSGTGSVDCSNGSITMGPQAMEGDLKLNPGATLKAGYDFTIPGAHGPISVSVANASVTFTPRCGSSASTTNLVVSLSSYSVLVPANNSDWWPSGDQSSPLVYQGSTTVPNICSGGQVRFDQGGTFSAIIQAS